MPAEQRGEGGGCTEQGEGGGCPEWGGGCPEQQLTIKLLKYIGFFMMSHDQG